VTGRDAIRAGFENAFALAEMVCIPENIFEDGEWGILEWSDPLGRRWTATSGWVVSSLPREDDDLV
jgi:hypothetical protein